MTVQIMSSVFFPFMSTEGGNCIKSKGNNGKMLINALKAANQQSFMQIYGKVSKSKTSIENAK